MITSGSFFFTALIQILIGLFQKELAMNKVAISEVISRLILLVGTVISVWCNWHILSILIFTVLSSLVQFAVLYLYSRKYIFIKLRFDFALWKKILIKSWPLAITIALNLIYLKADTLILSLIKSEEIVGLYGAAYKVVDVLITLPFMFAGIVLQKSFDTMLIIAIPLAVGAQFVSNRVMSLVAGEAFYNSGSILKILIIACAIVFVQVIFSHAVIAIEKQKKLIAGYLFTAVTALAG
ncbi:MAG: oligosaccharide flippase family protein [Candidatus Falkowbacteria bacterium]|nr:oligosaccharide flippase family protein [Candidatus Falkowbacteria bacterium]